MARPLFVASVLLLPVLGLAQDMTQVALTVDPGRVLHRVDERIYGHFLEHIYHSVNGGLWGEMVWNRSFEDGPGVGGWQIRGNAVSQQGVGTNLRLPFGDADWTDYEYTLEARKTGGNEGFLLLFRAAGDDDFYWLNLGGWANTRHALERGIKGAGRWGVIKDLGAGSIETGHWYKIRLRCEGRHFQAWLDDRLVLDFTDDQKAHLAGRVGVGTWATQAEYRNFKVTRLDGRVLFGGLPFIENTGPFAARFWSTYGTGEIVADADRPLNSSVSVRLVAESGECGIQQQPFSLREGVTYRGSVWARGSSFLGLVLRLRDGTKTLAQVNLGRPSTEWSEFPFKFTARETVDEATLQVGLLGRGRLWVDQVSLMGDEAAGTGGYRPDLLKAVADLRPPVIRWPGGCFAEYYRWKDAIGPQSQRRSYPISIWDDVDVNSFGVDEFVQMCRKVGAEPLIVINTGRHDSTTPQPQYVQEACDWIEYCNGPATSEWGKVRAANGHPEPYNVRLWEIDNETWSLGAERYVEVVKAFAPAMRKADPKLQILVCGGSGTNPAGNNDWNAKVLKGCGELFDYLSIHHYENPDRYADGPRVYENLFRKLGEMIAASPNPKVKVFVSEWNAQSTDWRTGLYCGGLLNAFERCGDVVTMGSPALWLRHVSATAWDNALINFDQRTWFPAPNYVVMKLWRDHFAPDLIAVEGPQSPLNVAATATPDSRTLYLKCVNPMPQIATVVVTLKPPYSVRSAALELVNPGDLKMRNNLVLSHQVVAAGAPTTVAGRIVTFTMPGLSAGVLTVETP